MYYLTKTKVSQRRKKLFGRFMTSSLGKEENGKPVVIKNGNEAGFTTLGEAVRAARRENPGLPLYFRLSELTETTKTFVGRTRFETEDDGTVVYYEYDIMQI